MVGALVSSIAGELPIHSTGIKSVAFKAINGETPMNCGTADPAETAKSVTH